VYCVAQALPVFWSTSQAGTTQSVVDDAPVLTALMGKVSIAHRQSLWHTSQVHRTQAEPVAHESVAHRQICLCAHKTG